jgi:hypothetical protein
MRIIVKAQVFSQWVAQLAGSTPSEREVISSNPSPLLSEHVNKKKKLKYF